MSLVGDLDAAERLGFLTRPVPDHVLENLPGRISLRPYQRQALARFLYYIEEYPQRRTPTHLLFHMATGSGKTVLMAALILDLFTRGHRNFLFFVNSAQIVAKTKANFLEPAWSKYLFADPVRISNRPVAIREVGSFEESDPDGINILFTTVQGLHSRMRDPRENTVTLEDFQERAIVLISDEAHHLNADTAANPSQGELELRNSWEGTVNEIFGADPGNVMLEFTATVNLGHPAIAVKYDDKILYDYALRRFREDGYSKDIMLREVQAGASTRMLQAAILSQYRRKLAEAHGLAIKPVILMKSHRIDQSNDNEALFHALIDELDGERISAMRGEAADPTLRRAFAYVLDERGTDPGDFARELRREFGPARTINVNNDNLASLQIALNTLEDRDNELRVIFAVDKLNEGWDVLNLFDIVRLYDTRTNGTSNAEKQLIGRGARYLPFRSPEKPDEPLEQRKYDSDINAPLRILEQLHYHCSHDPDYIRHIKEVLVKDGIMAADEREVVLRLKESFRRSDFFKNESVMQNALVRNRRAGVNGIADYAAIGRIRFPDFSTGRVTERGAFGGETTSAGGGEPQMRVIRLKDLGTATVRRALDGNPFFHFGRLRHHFPQLAGIQTFIESPQFLGAIEAELRGCAERLDSLSARDRLDIAVHILEAVEAAIRRGSVDKVGSRQFRPHAIAHLFGEDKTVKIAAEGERGRSWRESPILRDLRLDTKSWFVFEDNFGTSEEKTFIRWLSDRAPALEALYPEFYLLRNERVVRLYDFDDGAAMEPDFLLFLRKRGKEKDLILQLFIEPKGPHLLLHDGWKEKFLKSIHGGAEVTLFQGKEYRLYGLPFFTDGDAGRMQAFEQAFEAITQ